MDKLSSIGLDKLRVAQGAPLEWGRRTYVMGIINLSPDSFSGDGLGKDLAAVVDQAVRFQEEGADFLDLGAESTRPGSTPIEPDAELALLLPALEALAPMASIPLSVDTYKAEVARQAVAAGATIINDVWGLKADPELASVAAESGAPLILMHNQRNRIYGQLLPEVLDSLLNSVNVATRAGVRREQIVLDPGIGFGKSPDHNLEIMNRLGRSGTWDFPY